METFHKTQGWSIVLADDCENCLAVLSDILELHGMVVHQACDGIQALDLLETLHPNAVLLDLHMPRLDGWDTLSVIRDNPHLADLPVIAISAFSRLDREAKAAGFDGIIDKITDADRIIQIIYQGVCDRQAAEGV